MVVTGRTEFRRGGRIRLRAYLFSGETVLGWIRVAVGSRSWAEDTSHLILQLAVEKRATIVGVAEPWGGEGRRKQQAGYEIAYDSKYLTIYRLQGRDIEVRGVGDWAMAGGEIALAYLKPEFNWRTVITRLRTMERQGANTVIGDLNCNRNKRQKLEEWMEEEEMQDIGTAEYTHKWGAHRCVIDRAITRSNARPWDHGSDHAVIGAKAEIRHNVRKLTPEENRLGEGYKMDMFCSIQQSGRLVNGTFHWPMGRYLQLERSIQQSRTDPR